MLLMQTTTVAIYIKKLSFVFIIKNLYKTNKISTTERELPIWEDFALFDNSKIFILILFAIFKIIFLLITYFSIKITIFI